MTAEPRVWPSLVPYQQPPENLASDQRRALLWTLEHEITRARQAGLTARQEAAAILTRLDLLGIAPGNHPTARPRPGTLQRGICPTHGDQGPCRGCAADRKATRNED